MPRHTSPAATVRACAPAVLTALSLCALPLAAQDSVAAAGLTAADTTVAIETAMPETQPAAPVAEPSAPQPAATAELPTGPTRFGAAVAARPMRAAYTPSAGDSRKAMAAPPHAGPAVALMLVGATAVVLGMVVGGDAAAPLIVGGAVVGLIGLYQYLL